MSLSDVRVIEGLKECCKKLKLTTDEKNDIVVGDELLLEELRKGKNSIIEKVHIDHYVNKEVLRSTMVEAWRTTKLFSIREISIREIQDNSFIISLHNHTNMENVLSRKP